VDADGKSKLLAVPEKVRGALAVYDIAVDEPHNYFAGGILVHNKSRDYSPHLDDPWYQLWPQWRREFKQIWPAKEDAGQRGER
jgi:hypothetical protein